MWWKYVFILKATIYLRFLRILSNIFPFLFCFLAYIQVSKKRRRFGRSMSYPEMDDEEEEGEEEHKEDEEEEEDEFQPSEGSENEMETEILDYMWQNVIHFHNMKIKACLRTFLLSIFILKIKNKKNLTKEDIFLKRTQTRTLDFLIFTYIKWSLFDITT